MRALFLLLLIFSIGCTTPITSLDGMLPKGEDWARHATVDTLLKHYFTDEAYDAIKDIPTVEGVGVTAHVTGINIWTNILSIIVGNGIGRKVVIPDGFLKERGVITIIHEYLHHLDDLTRDGEYDFFDYDEFKDAYKKMATDIMYAEIVIYTDSKANNWLTDTFGVGEYSEHLAYSGSNVVLNNGPTYFKKVFRKVFKKFEGL